MSTLRRNSIDSKASGSDAFKPQSTYSDFTLSNFVCESVEKDDSETFLEVDRVRVTPPKLIFNDAFEGRKFKEKVVIQNCGKNMAFIRICAPSSYAFIVDVNPRGQNLSPGLKIVTNISYTHKYRASAPATQIPIFINGKLVKYKIFVTKSKAQITAVPQYIDFGTVNADRFPVSKTILLTNEGSKGTRFAIDLGPNKLQLIVKPMRGLLEPKSSISLRVEMSANKEGLFNDELWIKCDAPIRIQVSVNFIFPRLTIFCSNATRDFIFVDFPKTYLGATHTKFLVIKNDSATAKMFCIRAEIDKDTASLLRAREIRQDYKCFTILPIEGRLRPQEGRIIEIKFTPKPLQKTGVFDCHDDYALCFVRVIQINSGEIKLDVVSLDAKKETELPILSSDYDNEFDSLSLSIDATNRSNQFEMVKMMKTDVCHHKYHCLCLHGEFEKPDISIKPYSLTIVGMKLKQQENRVLVLKNNSKHLSIIFRYQNSPGIIVKPKESSLKPLESIEVDVQIIPTKIGHVQEDIVFNLFYQNQPENVDTVIGKKSVSVDYNVVAVTTIPNQDVGIQGPKEVEILSEIVDTRIPKGTKNKMIRTPKVFLNNGYLHFPNDLSSTFRSWTSNIPKAVNAYAATSRPKTTGDAYALSESEKQVKNLLRAYYNSYIRRSNSKCVKYWDRTLPDYDVGDGKNLLMEKKLKYPANKLKQEKIPSFIPLTPTQIYKLKIYPDVINFDKVAQNSHVIKSIRLQNTNSIPVNMFLECRHPSITFKGGPRIVLPAKGEVVVEVKYSATETGRYNIVINVTVNENHYFYIAVFVEVIPKYILVNTDKVEFISNDVDPKFIEVFNPLNAPVYCKWVVPVSCFSIHPRSCVVEPKSSFPFMVTFKPHPSAATVIHVILILENNANVTIPISATLIEPTVTLRYTELVLDHLPLNILTRRKFFIRNEGRETITVTLTNPEPRAGIKISPANSIVHGHSDLILEVDVKISSYVDFDCIVYFVLQRFYQQEIRLIGSIDYPKISFEPKEFDFRKIPVHAITNLPLTIINNSNTLVKIHFYLENLPDFNISYFSAIDQIFADKTEVYLKKNETKNLILEFKPTDMACYNGILQYKINDVVGTSLKNNLSSGDMEEPTNVGVNFYKELVTKPLPQAERILVTGKTTYPILLFSCLQFDFCYFPCQFYKSVTRRMLEISNVSDVRIKLFLKLDDSKKNFTIRKVVSCNVVTDYFQLESNQTVAFEIIFHPSSPGCYKISIPVYVQGQMNGSPFNYINLSGVYPNTTIETEETILCLEPVPLGCFSTKIIKLKTSYHKSNCFIQTKTNTENISVSITHDHSPNTTNFERKYSVIISFTSTSSINSIEKITFFCKCPSEKTITLVVCSENSIFTTHSFLQSNYFKDIDEVFPDFMIKKNADCFENLSNVETLDSYDILEAHSHTYTKVYLNETSYPFFPDDDDKTAYAEYMRKTLSALENWMYEQCFYYNQFYCIPKGICTPKIVDFNDKKKKPKIVLPFLELLSNIAGPTFTKSTKRSVVTDETEKTFIIHSTYGDVLKTLTSHGANLAHIHPEYLLEYECYVEYMEQRKPRKSITNCGHSMLDEKRFYLLAKQCWMDLILQTLKIYILFRIDVTTNRSEAKYHLRVIPSLMSKKAKRSSKRMYDIESGSFLNQFTNSVIPDQSIYSISGLMLLSWLEYNFDKQREILWHECKLKHRHIQHFDKDLRDGIVLASVTASYCPYLSECFQKLFLVPDSYEKQFYNAVCLLKAWSFINISFRIYPHQIVKANRIQMLLLVTYLYDYLPTLIPNKCITMIANHTCSISEIITVKNLSNHPIAYQIKLFGKHTKFVESDIKLLIIRGNREGSVTITYHARKVAHLYTTLLFCGDTPNYHYSKSFAISLEGIPDISFVKNTITLRDNLYQIFPATLKFVSPYLEPAVYDIRYSYTIPKDIENFPIDLISYKEYLQLALPCAINMADHITCNSDGIAISEAKCCTLVPKTREFIVYFLNENLGDFPTKIILAPNKQRTQYETITVQIPKDFASTKCYCKISKFGIRCSHELNLHVPNKNNLMWSIVERIFFELREKDDIPFWKKYLGTPAASHLIKHMFAAEKHSAPSVIKHIFNTKVTYKVVPDENPAPPATLPETITVNDVSSDGFFTVRMHVHADPPSDFYFNMVAEDESDIRYYKVKFLKHT